MYSKLVAFVEKITRMDGKYPYLNKTEIVSDAYKLLEDLRKSQQHLSKSGSKYIREGYGDY